MARSEIHFSMVAISCFSIRIIARKRSTYDPDIITPNRVVNRKNEGVLQ